MQIVLVHPAGSNWLSGHQDIVSIANRMAPLGLLSISAFLKQHGHETFILDCLGPKPPKSLEAAIHWILAKNPEIVAFSTTTSGFLDAYEMAAALKQRAPSVKMLFGGVHVSALGASLMPRFPAIDYLAIGEGEETMLELAQGKALAQIDGLVFRDHDRVITNSPRVPVRELDSLPFPDYAGLEGFPKGYNLPLFSFVNTPGATLSTSRGCPYQCSFCDRSVFKRSFRSNSADYIYRHMKHLRDVFGVKHINIYDDLFTLKRSRIAELCEKLKKEPLGVEFNCAVRVGYADDALLKMLKDAGCLMVSLGIESADPEMLERHKSGVGLDEVRDTVRRIKAVGLRAKGLFMMGLPGETEASIQLTSDFILSLGLDEMNMAKFTPFPGAPIWKELPEEGTFEEDWRKMNCMNFVFVPKTLPSKAKLDYLYNWHVKRFYLDREWRRRFARRIWSHRWSLWHVVKHLPAFLSARKQFEPKAVVEVSTGFLPEKSVTTKVASSRTEVHSIEWRK